MGNVEESSGAFGSLDWLRFGYVGKGACGLLSTLSTAESACPRLESYDCFREPGFESQSALIDPMLPLDLELVEFCCAAVADGDGPTLKGRFSAHSGRPGDHGPARTNVCSRRSADIVVGKSPRKARTSASVGRLVELSTHCRPSIPRIGRLEADIQAKCDKRSSARGTVVTPTYPKHDPGLQVASSRAPRNGDRRRVPRAEAGLADRILITPALVRWDRLR
jgi:hypothetical protein